MTVLDIEMLKAATDSEADYRKALEGAETVHKFGLVEVCEHLEPCGECRHVREDPERDDDKAIGCERCKDTGLVESKDEGGGDLDGFSLPFVVSTEAIDRDNDTINPKGWALKDFKRNPVVLFGHDSRSLPVARAPDTSIDRARAVLRSVAQFPAQELHPFGNLVGRLFRAKFLNAASVGFRPIDFKRAEDRDGFFPTDFKKQELLEWSAVPIPSNPEALVEARSAGFDLAPLVRWAEEALEKTGEAGIFIPRARLEEMRKAATGSRLVIAVSRDGGVEAIADGDPIEPPDISGLEWREVCERMARAIEDGDEGAREALAERYEETDLDPPGLDGVPYSSRDLEEIKRFGVVLPWATDPDKATEIVIDVDAREHDATTDEPAKSVADVKDAGGDDVETVDTNAQATLDKADEDGDSLSKSDGLTYAAERLRELLPAALKNALTDS